MVYLTARGPVKAVDGVSFQIQPGDEMRFDVLGRIITARVRSIRAVDFRDFRAGGFMIVFRPGPFDGAPHTYIAAVKGAIDPAARARMQGHLVTQYPNVSVIDLREVLNTVAGAILVLFLFGIALGILGCAIVLRLGPAAEWLIWPIPAVLSPFAGVFYPVATLPRWMQAVSWLLAPSYVFEAMRALVSGRAVSWPSLGIAALLAIGDILVAGWVFSRVYRHAVRTGAPKPDINTAQALKQTLLQGAVHRLDTGERHRHSACQHIRTARHQ